MARLGKDIANNIAKTKTLLNLAKVLLSEYAPMTHKMLTNVQADPAGTSTPGMLQEGMRLCSSKVMLCLMQLQMPVSLLDSCSPTAPCYVSVLLQILFLRELQDLLQQGGMPLPQTLQQAGICLHAAAAVRVATTTIPSTLHQVFSPLKQGRRTEMLITSFSASELGMPVRLMLKRWSVISLLVTLCLPPPRSSPAPCCSEGIFAPAAGSVLQMQSHQG
ncbi:uncharacterized protein PSFLO_05238 [Pseudozyma flocculosa]|uniref:Uncharacterized protein n=1 Tax=Pseudozyma flocculosa TaxID=84751 RepID=A0A5C3F7R5_9BASI|nr:uncharacterized protein PSFLO_05238 [Pseudozyma flocculosa]